MSRIKLRIFFLTLPIFIFSGLISCSKTEERADENEVKSAEMVSIDDEDLNESDEDLLTVDYKEFYDKLAPHGEWIEVKGSDIGADLNNKGTSSGHRSISFSDFFGVKDAVAEADLGAFFVWQPSPGLAVGLTAGETTPVYQPYTNGQWINTTSGWYFRAASEPEEITHHYGRWSYSPALGWVWVPGRVWAPAWVDWRENDEYVAWEPVPPTFYISNNVLAAPPVYEDRYVIVEKRYFIEPQVYKYHIHGKKDKIILQQWYRPDGIMVVNKTVINKGPDVTVIQNVYGRPIETVSINYVSNIGKVDYKANEYTVFKPDFKKVKKDIKLTSPVTRPERFSDKQSASNKEKQYNNENREKNEGKGEEKNFKKGNDLKERKYIDDKNMKNGNKNYNDDKNNKGNDNGKYNGNKKKDNGKQNKDNERNDRKQKENDKGGKDKGKGNGNNNSKLNQKEHKEKYNDRQNNNTRNGKNK